MVDITNIQQAPTVTPTIADIQPVRTAPSTTPGAIAGIAGLAGGLIQQHRTRQEQGNLDTAIGGIARDVAFINDSRASKEKLNDPLNSEIDTTSNHFKRLAVAKQQGVLDQSQIGLEVEKELKKAIRRAPAIESQLRGLARDLVGFDPTGSETRALLGLNNRSAPKLSKVEQELVNAQQYAAVIQESTGIVLDPKNIVATEALNRIREQQYESAAINVRVNQLGVEDAVIEMTGNLSSTVPGLMLDLMSQSKLQQGGFTPQQATSTVANHRQAARNQIEQALRTEGVTLNADVDSLLTRRLDEVYSQFNDIADDADFLKYVERNNKLFNQLAISGTAQAIPEFYGLRAALGEQAANFFLQVGYGQTPDTFRKDIERFDPALRELIIGGVFGAGTGTGTSVGTGSSQPTDGQVNAFRRYAQTVYSDTMTNGVIPENTPPEVVDYLTTKIIETGEIEAKTSYLEALQSSGAPIKGVSVYVREGGYGKASPQERKWTTDQYKSFKAITLPRIAQGVASNPNVELEITHNGARLVRTKEAVYRDPSTFAGGIPGHRPSANSFVNSDLNRDITALNQYLKGMQNGWVTSFGEGPGELVRTLNDSIGEYVPTPTTDSSLDIESSLSDIISTFKASTPSTLNPRSGILTGDDPSVQSIIDTAQGIINTQGEEAGKDFLRSNLNEFQIREIVSGFAPGN